MAGEEEQEEQLSFNDEIPDDVNLFPGAQEETEQEVTPEAEAREEKPPAKTAPVDAVEVETKEEKPDKSTKTPQEETPPSLKKMMADIQERDRALTEREQGLREADRWKRQAAEYERFMEDMRGNPVHALQKHGVDIQKVLGEQLGLTEPPPKEQVLETRLEKLERVLKEKEAQEAQGAERARIEAAHANVMKRYETMVSDETDTHPHLKAFADLAPDSMYTQAQSYAQMTGKWLPDDEAARRAEEVFSKQVLRVLEVASKMPQYESWFGQTPTNGASQDASLATTSRPPSGKKTLSQRDTSTPPPAVQPDDMIDRSDDEILAAGLAAYQSTVGGKSKK